MGSDVETKLSAARTRLILDKPFLGALVLRLPLVAADPKWCRSSATDARSLYYNPEYIEALSLEQTQFVLAHEALHCALSHFARRQHRDKHRWDLACDLAINPLLIEDGLSPVPDALFLPDFAEMTAEEIYPCLDESEHMQPHDDHIYDEESEGEGQEDSHGVSKPQGKGGSQQKQDLQGQGESEQREREGGEQGGRSHQGAARPQPLRKDEAEQLAIMWQQRMAGAAQMAMQAGKMGGALARMVEHLLQPQLPWRTLLARYMSATARDDYNWSRPSRREGEAILPSLRSQAIKVVVALDTSGSISDSELQQFVAEINALKGQVHARITLHACDDQLAKGGPWEYEPWEELELPKVFHGGRGTDFTPVFDWLNTQTPTADLVVYFTDGLGRYPDLEPAQPVIWLIKGKATVPWGQRIQLN